MNETNRRENLKDELHRGEESLRAAQALLDLGLYSDSISRAYYGVFHVLRALLLTRGIQPKTHGGVVNQFSIEFITSGLLPATFNRLLAGLQRARELADYDAAVQFGPDEARAELDDARALTAEVTKLMANQGWLT